MTSFPKVFVFYRWKCYAEFKGRRESQDERRTIMKKLFVLFLSILLVLITCLVSFANSSVSKKTTIKLDISTSKEDKEIIKYYKKIGDDTYTKQNNNIVMNFHSLLLFPNFRKPYDRAKSQCKIHISFFQLSQISSHAT